MKKSGGRALFMYGPDYRQGAEREPEGNTRMGYARDEKGTTAVKSDVAFLAGYISPEFKPRNNRV